jgi:hypothetical protein
LNFEILAGCVVLELWAWRAKKPPRFPRAVESEMLLLVDWEVNIFWIVQLAKEDN